MSLESNSHVKFTPDLGFITHQRHEPNKPRGLLVWLKSTDAHSSSLPLGKTTHCSAGGKFFAVKDPASSALIAREGSGIQVAIRTRAESNPYRSHEYREENKTAFPACNRVDVLIRPHLFSTRQSK
jgi:hypothetical protein